jgi:translation initiation factor 2 gamma subunit (eIF-2gamma)
MVTVPALVVSAVPAVRAVPVQASSVAEPGGIVAVVTRLGQLVGKAIIVVGEKLIKILPGYLPSVKGVYRVVGLALPIV